MKHICNAIFGREEFGREYKMRTNGDMMTLNLTRGQVCDLLLATTFASNESGAEKWEKLHESLKLQLDAFDEEGKE